MNVLENIEKVVSILTEIEKYKETLNFQLSNYDCMTQDLLHYIEKENLDAIKMCKVVRELKKIRLKRRKIKNDMELTRTFDNNKNKLINVENLSFLMSELARTNKRLHSEYKNRVYSNDFKELIRESEENENNRNKNVDSGK